MNKRTQLLTWQQQGRIKDIDKSLEVTQANIEPKTWFDFISKNLIILGFVSLAVGIIFFFAYNWNEMTKMTKFLLVQSLLVVSSVLYTQTKKYSHPSTGLLIFIALLIGALFAFFGQTYQTGKDPWQLFLLWMLCITPIAVVSRNSILWIMWLALLNLSLFLYLQIHHLFWGLFSFFEGTTLLYALINAGAALLFFFVVQIKDSSKSNLAFYAASLSAFFAFTWVSFYVVVGNGQIFIYSMAYVLWMAVTFYLFRVKSLDVMLLSAWSLSAIFFIMFVLTRLFEDAFNAATLLLFSIVLIAMTTFASKWLMRLLKESHGEAS
jgi:uncharacterized membrane protein